MIESLWGIKICLFPQFENRMGGEGWLRRQGRGSEINKRLYSKLLQ